MKIAEALALPVHKETKELYSLKGFHYDHVPELGLLDIHALNEEANTRIVIKTHVFHDFDGRRFWRMQSVWLDGQPVMITQNAGREGDDLAERFILNHAAFVNMIAYLFTLRHEEEIVVTDETYGRNDEPPTLGNFYGCTYEQITNTPQGRYPWEEEATTDAT